MIFRFTLNSETGPYILARDPIGWDKAEILFKRSPKYHGIFYEKNIDLTFYCGAGKEYIDNVVETLGIDTTVTIKIEISCSGSYVADAPDYSIDYSDDYGSQGRGAPVYEDLYLGKLDLKTWSTENNKSTVNIIQEGIADTVINRADTVIDITKLETLDGTALTAFDYAPYDFTFHSKDIVLQSSLQTDTDISISDSVPAAGSSGRIMFPVVLPIYTAELDTIHEYENFYTLGNSDPTLDPLAEYLFNPTFAGVHYITYDLRGTFTERPDNGLARSYNISFYKRQGNTRTFLFGWGNVSYGAGAGDQSYSYNLQGSFTANLIVGEQISFYVEIVNYLANGGENSNIIATHQMEAGSYFRVKSVTTTNPTEGKVFAVFETGARIAQSISNQTDAFRSDYFGRVNAQPYAIDQDGCGSHETLTNGGLIRNFPIHDTVVNGLTVPGRPLRISLNQYFDSLNAIHSLGMGIEKADDVFYIRIETKDYFYQDVLLFQLINVPDLKISVAPEYYYSKVNIGYEKWQIEQTNGLDEFNSGRQYDTGLKTIDNTLEAKSSLIASGYMIEITRRKQYPDSFTEDDEHDNDNFIVCTTNDLLEAEKDENFDSVDNILSPETSYNLRISPGRNMLRWSPVINAGLLKYEGREIKLTNGEGNFKMESKFSSDACPGRWNNNLFSEGQNIQWDDSDNSDSTPIWEPLIATFKYPLTRAQARLLQNNPYGYIEISERSTVFTKWYILEARYTPVGGMTEFKLLKKWQ
jgi:hypothetical protein